MLEERIERCAHTANRRERSQLTNEISEMLYETDAQLEVLTPLFRSDAAENWHSLSLILEEHSHRAAEVADWLSEMIESEDHSVQFRSMLCVMELDPRRHATLVARVLQFSDEQTFRSARVALVQYLANADLQEMTGAIGQLPNPLRGSFTALVDGRKTIETDEALLGESADALLLVAWAARAEGEGGRAVLEQLATDGLGDVRVAAQLLAARDDTERGV